MILLLILSIFRFFCSSNSRRSSDDHFQCQYIRCCLAFCLSLCQTGRLKLAFTKLTQFLTSFLVALDRPPCARCLACTCLSIISVKSSPFLPHSLSLRASLTLAVPGSHHELIARNYEREKEKSYTSPGERREGKWQTGNWHVFCRL